MIINIGLVGCGRWGKIIYENLIKRNLNISIATTQVKKNFLTNIKKHNSINLFKNYKLMLKINKLDGLIIASPPSTHEEIAIAALYSKIPVLIEKPIAMELKGVTKIFDIAIKKKLPLFVDYIHLYSPFFIKMIKLCKNKKIKRIISRAYSNGPIRNYSVLWDWLPHDLSMIRKICGNKKFKLIEKRILKKDKYGMNVKIIGEINNIVIDITVGNLYKVKKRILEVEFNDNKKIIYDDQKNYNKKLKLDKKYIIEKNILPLDNLLDKFIDNLKKNKINKKKLINKLEDEKKFSELITSDIEYIYNR